MKNTNFKLTILFDNISVNENLTPKWGFSCMIQCGGQYILFDSGSDGDILLGNMQALHFDPAQISNIVLSHDHWDHNGGFIKLLKQVTRPVDIFIPESTSKETERIFENVNCNVHRLKDSIEIIPNVWTTGEMGDELKEQGLILLTENGTMLITGCAHPGIVDMVEQVKRLFPDQSLQLVLGGFHLKSKNKVETEQIVNGLKKLEVARIAPSHCTGADAIEIINIRFLENFIHSGLGYSIDLP